MHDMDKLNKGHVQKVMQIAHEHILFMRRYPDKIKSVAKQLGITHDAALALAIADQICEEFTLVIND